MENTWFSALAHFEDMRKSGLPVENIEEVEKSLEDLVAQGLMEKLTGHPSGGTYYRLNLDFDQETL